MYVDSKFDNWGCGYCIFHFSGEKVMFDRYILRKFLPIFFGALFFFAFVIVLIDLMMNIFMYLNLRAPFLKVLQVELYYFPKALSFSIPMSVLFGTSYTLSDLYAKNELTSIFASGVSLFRFTLPILIFSLILSVFSQSRPCLH